MIWARIRDGIVVDCIVLDDVSLISLFSEGYSDFVRVDHLEPRPGIDWSYADGVFAPPEVQ